MRKLLGWSCVVLWAVIGLCAAGEASAAKKKSAAPAKSKKTSATASKSDSAGKSASKKGAAKSPAKKSGSASGSKKGTASKSGSKTGKTSSSKRGKKGAPRVTWRNRQLSPTPERYKEIQDALVAKGYLNAEDANGQWGQSSAAALKKFQAEQNIESTGKINSLSLIALGLGPKREALPGAKAAEPAASKPAEPAAPKPPETPPAQP